jgi:RNA-directed DNA polymerase
MGRQKTASAGAPRDKTGTWGKVDWQNARREVRRPNRIAKTVNEKRWNKVKTTTPADHSLQTIGLKR